MRETGDRRGGGASHERRIPNVPDVNMEMFDLFNFFLVPLLNDCGEVAAVQGDRHSRMPEHIIGWKSFITGATVQTYNNNIKQTSPIAFHSLNEMKRYFAVINRKSAALE